MLWYEKRGNVFWMFAHWKRLEELSEVNPTFLMKATFVKLPLWLLFNYSVSTLLYQYRFICHVCCHHCFNMQDCGSIFEMDAPLMVWAAYNLTCEQFVHILTPHERSISVRKQSDARRNMSKTLQVKSTWVRQITGTERNNPEQLIEAVEPPGLKCSTRWQSTAAATVAAFAVQLDGSRHE